MGGRLERATFWGALALLLLATLVAYRVLVGPEPGGAPPPRPPEVEPEPEPVPLVVAAATGDVTLVRGGVRAPLVAGDALRPDDALETAPGARVELAGGSYRVALEEGGRFDVQEITAELSRFRLGAGVATARVADDPARAVEIEAAPDVVARSTGGDLAVSRAGDVVAVGVLRGGAELRAGGERVVLRAGEQSVARAGGPPSAPAPIPPSLLLKVSWPKEQTTNQRRIVVTGRTDPGATVILGDERVSVGPDGRFTHVIVLREGRQRLAARAHGIGGSAFADGPAVLLDTRAPDARFETRDLWGAPRK
jgi:hypothetical protein